MGKQPIQVATVILAGGQGTRLHPLTLHHSKPAVTYGGRYRLIDIPISNSINSNFRQIFVIAQYLSGELQHHIHQTYQFDPFNPGAIDVLTPQEDEKGEKQWFQGTADAVRKNLPSILKSSATHFLILSGDQLYNINFQGMVSFAVEKKADLTIASLPVSEKEAPRMGLLQVDPTGKVVNFIEKPQKGVDLKAFELPATLAKGVDGARRYLGSMGIYVFQREALISLLEQDLRNDFGFHLIQTAVKQEKTFAYLYEGYWEDIGTVASYFEANLMLTESKEGLDTYDEKNPIYARPTFLPGPKIGSTKVIQSILCDGSLIDAAEISHSVIGLRSVIGKGSIIRDTVMMGNHFEWPQEATHCKREFGIGEFCQIEKAIIDEFVHIGNHVKLINEKKLDRYDGDGIFIRDGIIIVTAGTRLPDHFVL